MWVPFAFLQVSLLLRLLAGAREAAYPWRLGGTLGVVGMLLFVGTTLTVTWQVSVSALCRPLMPCHHTIP